jgi:hemerythrin superfamily protein
MANSNGAKVLDLIKEDHDQVKDLFQEFQEMVGHDKSTAKSISTQILTDLKMHAELEEKIVYPRLKEQDEELFQEAHEEHHVADLLIKELEQMPAEDPAFAAKMQVLQENVEHHIEEEESSMFDEIRDLSETVLDEMAEAWESQKMART